MLAQFCDSCAIRRLVAQCVDPQIALRDLQIAQIHRLRLTPSPVLPTQKRKLPMPINWRWPCPEEVDAWPWRPAGGTRSARECSGHCRFVWELAVRWVGCQWGIVIRQRSPSFRKFRWSPSPSFTTVPLWLWSSWFCG